MKAGMLNPFIKSLPVWCESMTGAPFTYHDATVVKPQSIGRDDGHWLIEVPIHGQLNGQVVYRLDNESALALASRTLMGMPVLEMDDLAVSALLELAKRAAATAALSLAERGFRCEVGRPAMVSERRRVASDIAIGIRLILEGEEGMKITTDLFLKEVPAHRLPTDGRYLH